MRLDTVIKRESVAISSMRSLFSRAKYGMTHSDLLDEVAKIIARMGKAPRYAKERVYGYKQALMDSAYETTLVFGGFVNGQFYSVHSSRPDYYGLNGIDPCEWHKVAQRLGHYWPTQHKGVMPFFVESV